MIALLQAAAEPSKVPLFIAGAVLVCWAILLAVLGLSRPNFPYGTAGARGVMTISLILAVTTMAMAVLVSK